MDLSLCLDLGRPWSHVLTLAIEAETHGFKRLFVPDHFMPVAPVGDPSTAPLLEGWTTLSALARETGAIGLATLVLGNGYRHPAVVANMAATLDQVSGGRLMLGLGAGWQENEHRAYGIDLPGLGERLDRLEEALHVIRALLDRDRASLDGTAYRLSDARSDPKPVQARLPILVGGGGELRTIPMAAQHADAWHTWAEPAEFARKSALLSQHAAAAGRGPAEIRRLTGQVVAVVAGDASDDDSGDIIGPSDEVAARLLDYADAGVDEFVIRDHARRPVEQVSRSLTALADEVASRLSGSSPTSAR